MLANALLVIIILSLMVLLFNFFRKRKIKKALTKLTPLQKDILKYIYHNQPCSEEDIKKHFLRNITEDKP